MEPEAVGFDRHSPGTKTVNSHCPKSRLGPIASMSIPVFFNLLPEPQGSAFVGRSSLTSLKKHAVKQEITQELWRICVWLVLNRSPPPP